VHFFHPPSAMMLKNSSLLIDISVHRCHSLPDFPESLFHPIIWLLLQSEGFLLQ
jgi:hypothetical protein